jgi:hypothetical protein
MRSLKVDMSALLAAAVWFLFFSTAVCWAAPLTFAGLEPGLSKKSEVDRVLGIPVKEIVPGILYDYPPQMDARRISIKYRPGAGVIETIDLYSNIACSKGEFREWLYLGDPDKSTRNKKNHLVEQYTSSGVVIHFSGFDDTSPVDFVTYFEPAGEKNPQNQSSRFAGSWIWFNGARVMCDRSGYCKATNGYEGPWTCIEEEKIQIKWGYKGGKVQYVDTVGLGPDGLTLKGRNQQGGAVSARRE